MSPRRPPMRNRSVKTTDEEWARAQAVADDRGEVLSEEIRRFLRDYARRAK